MRKRNKQKKMVYPKAIVEPEHDQVAKKALDWLKSDVTVKQYKMDNHKKALPDTALRDKQ